ncbi:MAG: protein kinase [Proteobacteria bacterium]|nr:protein kinase [Pseudomonadota bacterium]
MDVGTLIAGRYVLQAQAGTGAVGSVYRARDLNTGGEVAIKFLRQQVAQQDRRLARESTLLRTLRHPAIVGFLDSGRIAGRKRFLVMEWLDGIDLKVRLERDSLTIAESLHLAGRIASALAFAHSHGITHRDIKPGNIFLPHGKVEDAKLVDFGMAGWADATQTFTRPGSRLGTPLYMSPEQIRGSADLGPLTDVFSLGCVLFECLTGEPAFSIFSARNEKELFTHILDDELPTVCTMAPSVPRSVENLVQCMMAKERTLRPMSDQIGEEVDKVAGLLDKHVLQWKPPLAEKRAQTGTSAQHSIHVVVAASHSATPFIGRKRELSILLRAVNDCIEDEQAQALIVTGPPGFGKSRLCRELTGQLGRQGEDIGIWMARVGKLPSDSQLPAIAAFILSATGMAERMPGPSSRHLLRDYFTRYLSVEQSDHAIRVLTELFGAARPDDDTVEPKTVHGGVKTVRQELRRVFRDLLEAETRHHAVILFIDDLQWADRASVETLDQLMSDLAERPLLVLAAGRPEYRELFPDLWSEHLATEIRLGRLTQRAAETMIRSLLGNDVPPERVTELVERARGSPFYLQELARNAAETI